MATKALHDEQRYRYLFLLRDPAAPLGIPELALLASQLGRTPAELLRAAAVDAAVVAELPEDVRSPRRGRKSRR